MVMEKLIYSLKLDHENTSQLTMKMRSMSGVHMEIEKLSKLTISGNTIDICLIVLTVHNKDKHMI